VRGVREGDDPYHETLHAVYQVRSGRIPVHLRETGVEEEGEMKIRRVWAMPNKRTFQIQPISDIIQKYECAWLDPFTYPYTVDAMDYLSGFETDTQEGVLFDPPYSPRQLKECYDDIGMSLTDTKSSVWSQWRDEIARVIKPGGTCLSFGWNTVGLGKTRGFKLIEILLVCHGGMHNDTIVTVERKVYSQKRLVE